MAIIGCLKKTSRRSPTSSKRGSGPLKEDWAPLTHDRCILAVRFKRAADFEAARAAASRILKPIYGDDPKPGHEELNFRLLGQLHRGKESQTLSGDAFPTVHSVKKVDAYYREERLGLDPGERVGDGTVILAPHHRLLQFSRSRFPDYAPPRLRFTDVALLAELTDNPGASIEDWVCLTYYDSGGHSGSTMVDILGSGKDAPSLRRFITEKKSTGRLPRRSAAKDSKSDAKVEDSIISLELFNLIKKRNIVTIKELAGLDAVDLMISERGDRALLGEIGALLKPFDLKLKAMDGGQRGPRTFTDNIRRGFWDSLHFFAASANDVKACLQEIQDAYRLAGRTSLDWTEENSNVLYRETDCYAGHSSTSLQSDEIMVGQEATRGWWAIMSRRYSHRTPTKNALAFALSKKRKIFRVRRYFDQYAYYILYEKNRVTQATIVGRKIPDDIRDMAAQLPPLDLRWFQDKGALGSLETISSFINAPDIFVSLLGPDAKGFNEDFRGQLKVNSPQYRYIFR